MAEVVRVGVIGAGLMGKEVASAFGRWFMLKDPPCQPVLTAVADVAPEALDWFRSIKSVRHTTTDYRSLLEQPDVDVVYAAVPHDLHEQIYCDCLAAGKDLLAEKPFGVDLASAKRIADMAKTSGRFVRCSSEFPFYPGAQEVVARLRDLSAFGELIEVNAAFLHSSDLDTSKPINWKRQVMRCGEAGVMNDLGLHVCHIPFRFGLVPKTVFAQLQNIVRVRPDGKGGAADCDTWDNATLSGNLDGCAITRFETKRLAPGETNTWKVEVLGTRSSVRYSTKHPKTLWIGEGQEWRARDLGHASAFPVHTGGIFEFGFPDALLQMWAAFLHERSGSLGGAFGCATPEEALASHELWDAALRSAKSGRAETVRGVI